MTIRHYPWWPLSKVEAAWLHFTLHVRWKDLEDPSSWKSSRGDVSTLELSQPCAAELSRDHAKGESLLLTEEDADGHGPVWWATAVKRDIKHNFAHWLIFVLTCIGWIFGFSFLSKSLWYSSAANIGGEKNQSDLQFYGCTTTYWLRNADCGLDGQSCVPFASNVSVPFRCPNGCSSTTLGAARAVGAEIINWKPLIVGGGDVQQTYRADSWVCASAIHAGLFSDLKGGCGVLSLVGTYSDYEAKVANGLGSLSFNSTFPSSYRLERMDNGTGCSDDRWKGYFLNVVLSSFVGFVLQPKPIVFFWLLVCLGFWHVNMISEPRDFPPPIGVPFGDFLPTLFTAYAIWKLAVRFVWPAFNRLPIERTIWQLGFYWLGTLLNVVFASVPLNRLVASDLRSQPGALTSLIIIIIVVVIIVINQLRVVRKTGYLPKYLTLYITGGIIVGILAAVPGESLRLHHYIISLVLLPGAAFPTRLCLIYSSFLLGMFLNGVGRWGFDGLLQDVATVRGDGIISSDLPSFATQQATWAGVVANSTNTTASRGTVTWTPIPVNLTSSWDSFALLVDDVLRYQGTATSFNISSILSDYESDAAKNLTNSLNDVSVVSLSQQLASEPHYLRLAYVSQGQYGDFTQAATAFYNGTWIDAPPGAT
ncbi:hypothetical protein K437DRAFT_224606 [Tilletiaria anomala UBC 951]|uniref:LCCL domain-containing protein n=1 Tax=Tilletiaria anomala (strain ATCC 24038 / CBS 436.72 / UBC 951) TaxID=1037660 RepID=A0A066W1E9_TILAU|nr:uncharacterized protein K437DRAFT_224606 [Tilletiaria anomala UBC 951]KDN44874.1 hypothetical protein K437DRAFT_224606 [Tilletiaria anomala UBC 951]